MTAVIAANPAPAGQVSGEFVEGFSRSFPVGEHTFRVPDDITSIEVVVSGAAGGDGGRANPGAGGSGDFGNGSAGNAGTADGEGGTPMFNGFFSAIAGDGGDGAFGGGAGGNGGIASTSVLCSSGGGGGGSNLAPTGATSEAGVQGGDGSVEISWERSGQFVRDRPDAVAVQPTFTG